MEDEIEYASLSDFPLRWRFAEDATRWTVLPEADLRQFRPLSERCSRDQWARKLSPTATHLWVAGDNGVPYKDRIAEHRTNFDWSNDEEAEEAAAFLCRNMSIRGDAKVLFFWSHDCAAETTWKILLRYWTDFCYPSDDCNVVMPTEGDRLAIYAEGIVWVALRSSFAGHT